MIDKKILEKIFFIFFSSISVFLLKKRLLPYREGFLYKISQKMDFHAYSKLLKSLGKGTVIHKSVDIRGYSEVSIGSNCILNHGVEIYGDAGLVIGDNVGLSPFVKIYTTGTSLASVHNQIKYSESRGNKLRDFRPVEIGSNTVIFTNAIINPGVKIGKNCVIGPNTNVNFNVEDNTAIFDRPNIVKINNEKK